jgi:hypothetical protein
MYSPEAAETFVRKLSDTVWLVPCLVSSDAKTYLPMATPKSYDRKSRARHTWTKQEDLELQKLTGILGVKVWSQIARELNDIIYEGRPVRQGKQCRERWYNHVHPDLKIGKWNDTEDCILIERQKELGNRWNEIAKLMTGRTENGVKNRWKSLKKNAHKHFASCESPLDHLYNQKLQSAEHSQTTASSPHTQSYDPQPAVPSSIPKFSLDCIKKQTTQPSQPAEVHQQYPFLQSPFTNSPIIMDSVNGGFFPLSHFFCPDTSLYPYFDPEMASSPSLLLSRPGQQ